MLGVRNEAGVGSTRRYGTLDMLRAVAALGVVGVHVYSLNGDVLEGNRHLPTLLAYQGASGVWLFFALSGFVISRPFVAGLTRGQLPSVGQYARRRFFRIYPLFFLSLIGVMLFTFNWADASRESKLANVFLVMNLLPGQEAGNVLSVWWTLSIEVCFYVFVPVAAYLILRALRRAITPRQLALGVVVMWVLSAAWAVGFSTLHPDRTTIWLYHVFPATLCSFCPGILLAVSEQGDILSAPWRSRVESVLRRARVVFPLALVSLAAAAWSGSYLDHPPLATFSIQFYAIGYGLVVAWALRVRVPDRPWSRAWIWLGTISYGIYIWHALILGIIIEHRILLPFTPGWYLHEGYWFPVASHLNLLDDLFRYVWVVLLTVIVAATSWYLVESRFIRWAHRGPRSRAAP